MKGGCAAILSACETLADAGKDMPGTLAFVVNEKNRGEWETVPLAKKALPPCDCIIAEPTPSLHPSIGQKGLCRMEIAFSEILCMGRSTLPWAGVPLEAVPFLEWVKTLIP